MKVTADETFVVVGTFRNTIDADLASTKLKAAGISAFVSADDCGGMRPNLQLTEGVRLVVPARAAKLARRFLEERQK